MRMIFATREKSRILLRLSPVSKNFVTTDGRSTIGMSRPFHARRDGPHPDNVGKGLPTYDHWSAVRQVWRVRIRIDVRCA
jgi:hypothetical protein